MDKSQALYAFWASFGLMTYDESTVPDNASLPYITYETRIGSFGDTPKQLNASLWYRSSSWAGADAMMQVIYRRIGLGGVVLPCDGGAIWLKRGETFAQRMGDSSDDMIRRYVLQVEIEFLTE